MEKTVIAKTIKKMGFFPNNPTLPLIHYKNVLTQDSPEEIEKVFLKNGWKNSWIDSIYTFHHYHSNTHEVLGVASGMCQVQAGGPKGISLMLEKGDLLIIPVGVSHRNIEATDDFICVGAYPLDIEYDINFGEKEEFAQAEKNIKRVPLPLTDPIYGAKGPIFEYWK